MLSVTSPGGAWGPDLALLRQVVAHRNHALTTFANGVMALGTNVWVTALAVVVALLVGFRLRLTRQVVVALVAAGVAAVLAIALKDVFGRPRPPVELALAHGAGWSMPSTSAAIVAAPTVALLVALSRTGRLHPGPERRWLLLAAVVVNLVAGASVVYLGAHWGSDVLAGWAVGGGVGWALGRLSWRRRGTARG